MSLAVFGSGENPFPRSAANRLVLWILDVAKASSGFRSGGILFFFLLKSVESLSKENYANWRRN